jgi:hypothetical protein
MEVAPAASAAPLRERRPTPVRGVRAVTHHEDDGETRVRGFGSDVPAFLLRAAPTVRDSES